MSEQWENKISCPFYNFFEKKWEFRIFLSKSSLLQWQFTFPKKMKTCFHTCKMRLKAKIYRFSLVLIGSVRCVNFFVFCSYFFSSNIETEMLILCTWRRFQKIQKMCSVGTKMIEKEWIGRDSGPDGSENASKWAFENTRIPPVEKFSPQNNNIFLKRFCFDRLFLFRKNASDFVWSVRHLANF